MILLEDVTKEYEVTSGTAGQILAANHLNLHIPAGEIFGLVGANGAGKTTTLKMICGLTTPSAGTVTVNGVDVEKQPDEAQLHIGYLADFFSLYDELRVWEYLEYFARAYKLDPAAIPGRITEVIEQMGLATKRDSMVAGLSRGMKQRLGIGRAIIHDPPILILDEPAAGLDPKARVELRELLRQMNKAGKTIFITSHILPDLEDICTSIGIIERGKLIRVGRLQDVMEQGKIARRFRVRLAAAGFSLSAWLSAEAGVSDVTETADAAQFRFAGNDLELAGLVRRLVEAGAPVFCVEEITETLEQLYARVSTGEVS